MRLTVYHDTVCPFCRIGKRQLQRALQQWDGEPVQVTYQPFFLNPSIPPDGYDFIPYMTAKFNGRLPVAQALEGPRQMGQAVGLSFHMEKISKAPNSTLSHCLVALAPEASREAVIDDIYAAYFEHGQDIGLLQTLVEIGQAHGLEPDQLRLDLQSPALQAEVTAVAQQAQQMGISGVPFFVINNQYAFSGAQSPENILKVLRQVTTQTRENRDG
jgi:predicted DsbA family dithiol-disulfide isomerase